MNRYQYWRSNRARMVALRAWERRMMLEAQMKDFVVWAGFTNDKDDAIVLSHKNEKIACNEDIVFKDGVTLGDIIDNAKAHLIEHINAGT